MTQLLKTVQKNSWIFYLEKTSFVLSILTTLIFSYLFGQYNGFIKGNDVARKAFTEGLPTLSGSGKIPYELISEGYFHIFLVLLVILLFHLVSKGISTKLINLALISYVIYEYVTVFKLVNEIFDFENFESAYFDLVRQVIIFDYIGAISVICLFLIQVISVSLLSKKQNSDSLSP